MLRNLILLITLSLISLTAYSKPSSCHSIKTCTEKMNSIMGAHFIYGSGIKDSDVDLNGAEITLAIYERILEDAGYTVSKINEKTFMIIHARDARYNIGEVLEFDKGTDLNVLDNKIGYILISYQFEDEDFYSSDVARNLRPFLSRYARILDVGNKVLISETATSSKKLIKLIKTLDVKLSNKMKQKIRSQEEFRRKISLIEAGRVQGNHP